MARNLVILHAEQGEIGTTIHVFYDTCSSVTITTVELIFWSYCRYNSICLAHHVVYQLILHIFEQLEQF